MLRFLKISIPFLWRVIVNSEGKGVLKSNIYKLKKSMKLNWNFQSGGEV